MENTLACIYALWYNTPRPFLVKEDAVSSLTKLLRAHPNLVTWAVLAIGMVLMVLYAAKDVGFQPLQMLALVIATTILAGLCVWIINWE
jgi:hypothetical protein